MKYLTTAILLTILLSCSIQRKLEKRYVGKTAGTLTERFENPVKVTESNDGTLYEFRNIKDLKSTEVSQGRLTLDPMISPKVKKTEIYIFTVKNCLITKVDYREEYKR